MEWAGQDAELQVVQLMSALQPEVRLFNPSTPSHVDEGPGRPVFSTSPFACPSAPLSPLHLCTFSSLFTPFPPLPPRFP